MPEDKIGVNILWHRSVGLTFTSRGRAMLSCFDVSSLLQLDGQELGGRWLKILMAIDKPARPAYNAESKPKPEGCTTVFIGNLSWNIDEVRSSIFASCYPLFRASFSVFP